MERHWSQIATGLQGEVESLRKLNEKLTDENTLLFHRVTNGEKR
jgi:hypothetical protein